MTTAAAVESRNSSVVMESDSEQHRRVITTMQLDGDVSVDNSALQMISFFSNEGEDDHVKKDLILGVPSNDDTLPYYQPKQPVEMQIIKRTAA